MIRKLLQGNAGQTMLEFALLLPSFMFVIIGIFDLSRGIYTYNAMAEAARAGARYALVRGINASDTVGTCYLAGECTCPPVVRTEILTRFIAIDTDNVTTNCNWPDSNTNKRGQRMTVEVDYRFVPVLVSVIGGSDGIPLHAETTVVIEY